jgi:hypothetical protein
MTNFSNLTIAQTLNEVNSANHSTHFDKAEETRERIREKTEQQALGILVLREEGIKSCTSPSHAISINNLPNDILSAIFSYLKIPTALFLCV